MLISANPGPQSLALSVIGCPWLFYGGARGGGKTYYLILDWLQSALLYGKNWAGVVFRRTYPELEDVIKQAREILIPLGAKYNGSTRIFRLPNGATLKMRYIRNLQDVASYQGHEYQWIGIDEAGNFPSADILEQIWQSSRTSKIAGLPRRLRLTGNPGGVGHGWLRKMFVDPVPPFTMHKGRMFIPSLVTDNLALMSNDPLYAQQLSEISNPVLRAAWYEGRWDIMAGQYFDEAIPDKLEITLDSIPPQWPVFSGYDHGLSSPYALVICAISDGELGIPRGTVVVLAEVYGGKDGKGFRHSPSTIAEKIVKTLQKYGGDGNPIFADPSIFTSQGGPSIAEQLANCGVKNLCKADNTRLAGWLQLRQRIRANTLKMIKGQTQETLRSLLDATIDIKDPEDVDTTGDDHALDALRYAIMSRPYAPEKTEKVDHNLLTHDTLMRMIKAQRDPSR